jgi:nucleotide-binding universal stress UspA family protein
MKTILVPVDFSDTSYNAAVYALELAKQIAAGKVVLYHAYELPIIADGGLAIPLLVSVDDVKKSSTEALQSFKHRLLKNCGVLPFTIEIENSYNGVTLGIAETAEMLNASLIVMGITGGSAVTEVLIGSNTIDVAKHTKTPVIIVPANAVFKSIKSTLIASTLLNINDTMPVEAIINFLDETKSDLHILHVEHGEKNKGYLGTDFESMAIDTLFAGYKPKYHFVNNPHFAEGVNEFVDSNSIDILIVIPKKHSLFESLLNKSHTKMLAFHSHVPLMIVHE